MRKEEANKSQCNHKWSLSRNRKQEPHGLFSYVRHKHTVIDDMGYSGDLDFICQTLSFLNRISSWNTELVKTLTAAGFIFIKVAVSHSITKQERWDTLAFWALEFRITAELRRGAGRAIYFIRSICTIFSSITLLWGRDTLDRVETSKLVFFTQWWLQ